MQITTSSHDSVPDYCEDPTENERQYDAVRADKDLHLVLRIINGDDAGGVVVLNEGSLVIGRARGVDIRIDSRGVSRVHARVVRVGDAVMVEDLGSRNGTWFENSRLTGRRRLLDGQRISIDGTVMRLSRLDPQDLAITLALADAARNDPLTGTFHRGYFDRRLCAEVERSGQNERSTSLVMIDIDYFKKINDEHGHTTGDSVLRSVAAIISGVTRVEDVVARYGGEEFAIIVPGATMLGAALLAQRVRTAIEQATIDANGRPLRVTASLGVATVECGQTASAHELICAADEALYAAKREGRNRVHIGKLGRDVEHPASEIPVTLTMVTER